MTKAAKAKPLKPPQVKKIKPAEAQKKRHEIIAWAQEFGFIINPSKGYELYVANYFYFGHCPCDVTKTRTKCPCTESIQEVQDQGHCLCRLYWRDLKTFEETLK